MYDRFHGAGSAQLAVRSSEEKIRLLPVLSLPEDGLDMLLCAVPNSQGRCDKRTILHSTSF